MMDALRNGLWRARRLRHLGWPGAAGAALAALLVVAHFQETEPLREEVAELRHSANDLRAKVAARRAVAKASSPVEQLKDFYEFFPDAETIADTLGRLHEAAAAENLMLEQGEYRLAPEQGSQLVRYDIALPVKGPYPRLRRFLARALRENQSLALEGVSIGRQGAMNIGVDAQVRLTLYLRASP